MTRKYDEHSSALGISPLDTMAADLLENKAALINCGGGGASVDSNNRRFRSNSYGASKDHGYETIPADNMRLISSSQGVGGGVGIMENRKSDCYPNLLQKERQRGDGMLNSFFRSFILRYSKQSFK